MKRSNAVQIKIKNPGKGLLNTAPPNFSASEKGQYWTVTKNVRCQDGAAEAGPGYERVVPEGDLLDSAPNLIFNANLSSPGEDQTRQDLSIIGTGGGLYVMDRGSRTNICHPDADPGNVNTTTTTTTSCEVFFAYIADSGYDRAERDSVTAIMEDTYPVDFIVHGGDMIYESGNNPWDRKRDSYEENFFKAYYPWVKNYKGVYGIGPTGRQQFYPAANNHEWTDWPKPSNTSLTDSRYQELFSVPNENNWNKLGYQFKRGPVHFIVPDTYGPDTKGGAGVGQLDLSSTGPMALWVKAQLEASDCAWKVVCMNYPPFTSNETEGAAGGGLGPPYNGYSTLRWPLTTWGASVVLAADVHNFEHIRHEGLDYFNCGCGGAILDAVDGTTIQTDQPALGATSLDQQSDYGLLRFRAGQDFLQIAFHDSFGDPTYTTSLSTTAGTVCYLGEKANEVKALEVYPAEGGTMEEGQQWPLQALLFTVDNDFTDVASLATWTTDNSSRAVVNASGVVTAVGTGSCNITATYKGLSTSVPFQINTACNDKGHDYFLLLEASESMAAASGPGTTRWDKMVVALKAFADSLDPAKDRIGLIAFSGTYASQTALLKAFVPYTNDFDIVKATVEGVAPSGDNNTYAAVSAANEYMLRNFRREADRTLVIFNDTCPNITTDGTGTTSSLAASQAAALASVASPILAIKNNTNITIRTVHLDIYEETPETTTMAAWADNGNHTSLFSADDLYAFWLQLDNSVCALGDSGSYYLTESPCGSNPRLNYAQFTNWDVISGEVDLIGIGNTAVALYDIYNYGQAHGQGLYVDLAGSGPAFNGIIRSKSSYTLTMGQTYRLTWKAAGNWREDVADYGYGVTLKRDGAGTDRIAEYFVINNWQELFTEHSLEVTGDGNDYFLQFAQGTDTPDRTSSFGILLDDIEFKNITTDTVILADDFDTETC